jgi:hypothetical protein
MDIYIESRGSVRPDEFGNSWCSCPELSGWNKPRVLKNEKSFKAVCPLTGIAIFVLRDTEEGRQIRKYLEKAEVALLRLYVAKLVLNNAPYSEIDRAINAIKEEEYQRGRTEMQEEFRELLGL